MGTYNRFFKPKTSICPALRVKVRPEDNLPQFGSICLNLNIFSGFYKIMRKIKVFMPKYFV